MLGKLKPADLKNGPVIGVFGKRLGKLELPSFKTFKNPSNPHGIRLSRDFRGFKKPGKSAFPWCQK